MGNINDIETEKRLSEMEDRVKRLRKNKTNGLEMLSKEEYELVLGRRERTISELEEEIRKTENELIDSMMAKADQNARVAVIDKDGWTHRFSGATARLDNGMVEITFDDATGMSPEFIDTLAGGSVEMDGSSVKLGDVVMKEYSSFSEFGKGAVKRMRIIFEREGEESQKPDKNTVGSFYRGLMSGIMFNYMTEDVCGDTGGPRISFPDDVTDEVADEIRRHFGVNGPCELSLAGIFTESTMDDGEKDYVMYDKENGKFVYVPGRGVTDRGIVKIHFSKMI